MFIITKVSVNHLRIELMVPGGGANMNDELFGAKIDVYCFVMHIY